MKTLQDSTASGYQIVKETKEISGYNAGMRGTKDSEYDGGHHVPFIISWSKGGLSGGKKLNDLTAHVDMLPTLVKLTGQEFISTKTIDGTDVSSYLLGNEEAS